MDGIQRKQIRPLIGLGLLSAAIYGYVAWLSSAFAYGTPGTSRPLFFVTGLLFVSFLVYLLAIRVVLSAGPSRSLGLAILSAGVVFRVITIFGHPIQEVDFYRYLWDGQCLRSGVQPYKYSPLQVQLAAAGVTKDPDLNRLVQLHKSSQSYRLILDRIDYNQYTSPYPPAAQIVFWLSAVTTRQGASVASHILILKAWLFFFDVATVIAVWWLISMSRLHVGWLVAYAWCPLVMKEFSNSAHLDSIAVFFATVSLGIIAWAASKPPRQSLIACVGGGLCVAMSIAAKLFAVVLLPMMTWFLLRKSGTRSAVAFILSAGLISGVLLTPMYLLNKSSSSETVSGSADELTTQPDNAGLTAFLSAWRMNDLVFMVVQENVQAPGDPEVQPTPWFVIVPESARVSIDAWGRRWSKNPSFWIARFVCATIFVVIASRLLLRVVPSTSPKEMFETAFLTLAAFWFLLPTQNPWYWTWALPLVCFAQNRAWLLVSGMVLLYYLRYWFSYHMTLEPVLGTPYRGEFFFHYVVVWIEHGTILVAILAYRYRYFDRHKNGGLAS